MSIHDLVTASNIVSYVEGVTPEDQSIGARLFPAAKQLGLRLDFIKGANNQSVVLKASAFDTQASLRERMGLELTSENMPFFREGMLVKEEDRQQLNMLMATGNQSMVDVVLSRIYDDAKTLADAARTRVQAMRMHVLATGQLHVSSNGINRVFDYGVSASNKGDVATDWSKTEATPLNDIDRVIEKMAELGVQPAGMVMNSKTYSQIRKNESVSKAVTDVKSRPATRRQLTDYLFEEFGLRVELVDGSYTNDEGKVVKFFPDGYVTFVPNQSVGRTVFGTTPEESDLMNGVTDADVHVIETGIALTTIPNMHPVNVETLASMITLPSFEGANLVYQLKTDLSLDQRVDGNESEEES